MPYIKEFLQRERQRLLDEFGVPDLRSLLYLAALWAAFYTIVAIALIGVLAVGNFFGLAAMFAVVFILFVIALRMEGSAAVYRGDEWLGSEPRLPPPGKRALPPAGMRAITDNRSHTRMLK